MSPRIPVLGLALLVGAAAAAVAQPDRTAQRFRALDRNRDGRITAAEWQSDRESFRRADRNRDNSLSPAEFSGQDRMAYDDREDIFEDLDGDRDGRVSAAEWTGTDERFDALDDNGDRWLTRREIFGGNPPADLFRRVDVNRDRTISRGEWQWSRSSFERRDVNRDGRLTRREFEGVPPQTRSAAYQAGYQRGLSEGAAAGREDRERNQPWDLEGQREMQSADSGYVPSIGPLPEYQNGYRDGFRRAYPPAFDGRQRQ